MKVHESIDIAVRPAEVWPFLADPQRMADWHAKLVEVRRGDAGSAYPGERFEATYVMRSGGRRQGVTTEVVRLEPWTTLVLRHHARFGKREGYVDETFERQPRGDGAATHLEHTVDFAGAGMPLWLRALMWFITRFGQPSGEGILEPLKAACETGKTPAAINSSDT